MDCLHCSIRPLCFINKLLLIWHTFQLTLCLSFLWFKAADCSSLPPVPAPCLNPSEHQGPTIGVDASSHGSKKTEKRSTIRETFSTKRCHSAKLVRKYNQKKNSCTMRYSHSQLQVKGRSPAVLTSTRKNQPQTFATPNIKEQVPETSLCSSKRIGPLLNVQVSAAEEQESKPPLDRTGKQKQQQ